jgi:aryl-alcohol dehydrogenase-like predicted oxidoreductase
MKIAEKLDMTTAQLAIAWCLQNKHVSTVITGASKVKQVRENMQVSELKDRLNPDIMAKIDKILGNKPEIVVF